ncbi:ABC transporter ATP-binding protein [Neobacillus vireti]|uniref:ABC transporter ATP-binding protein n=1 Tax=Neobacillus vireti LMG 21834 TaxID=1131730 RepID=A0AB94ISS4_9BACI|nr:ABC transporter ATP-binding protein [Neobacillus vireti]ETI70129.1 ABC transporter ATP-binding protein [Neobacillus vireti LMG 21834]KLT16491.1 multidrug ABC transporter ATP-binding protein [Neobacillus vireti]
MTSVLEVKNIVKIYDDEKDQFATKALNRINLKIEKGELVAIMGPSGSGKTTLLNLLSGIDSPTSGTIHIANKELSTMNKEELALFRRQHLGFVFQEFNLLDSLSLKENVMLPMILEKRDAVYMETKTKEIMSTFGIYDIADKYPYSISGGQQQRAAVSRALANDPSIIFADEPTGNLDSKSSKTIMECFEKINKEMETTIVVVTHDVFAASYCNKVIFIKDGILDSQIVKKGNRKDFLDQIIDCLAVLGGGTHDD